MYQINRVLFIHLPVLNQLEYNYNNQIKTLTILFQVTFGMKMMMLLINSWKNGVWKKRFQINQNLLQESRELIFNIDKQPLWKTWPKNLYSLLGNIWWYLYLWFWFWENICYWWWRNSVCKWRWIFLIGILENPYETWTDHEYFLSTMIYLIQS